MPMVKIVTVSCLVFSLINITNWKLELFLFIRLSQNFKAETSFEVGPKVRKKTTAKPLMFYLQVC